MRNLRLLTLTVFFSFGLFSCSTGPKSPVSEMVASDPNLETVAILASNDIHGNLAPQTLKTHEAEGTPAVVYEAGGASVMASYIGILRSEFGPRMIWLDAGDEFQGTIESNLDSGAPMVQFFNAMGLTAAAIGNHEFDWGADTLKARMSEAKYSYLAANIFDKQSGKLAEFPNTSPSHLFSAGRVKIGVIGLSTVDTPTTTRAINVADYKFGGLSDATVQQAKALRDEGAEIVVIDAHVGLKCDLNHGRFGNTIRKPTDPQGGCDPGDEMTRLIDGLPEGTIDAVVSGHTHTLVHHWIRGIPVVQAGSTGRFLNVIYLTYDLANHRLATDLNRIEGPIPVCAKVFKNQGDCSGERSAPNGFKDGRGPLVQAHFHGRKIEEDPEISLLLAPTFAKSAEKKKQVVGNAARLTEHVRMGESPLGNLIADAVRASAKADIAIVNVGGIRANWESGPITYGDVFRSMPFDNYISTLKLSGKEVKLMLRIAESGSRGFCPTSGVRMRVIDPAYDAPSTDLDGDSHIEPWEVNRLIEARTEDGQPIRDEKMYRLATIDFLVTGGDDMKWFMSRIPTERIQMTTGEQIRDAVVQHLGRFQTINSIDKPLVDPADRRISFEKPVTKKARKRRHRKS